MKINYIVVSMTISTLFCLYHTPLQAENSDQTSARPYIEYDFCLSSQNPSQPESFDSPYVLWNASQVQLQIKRLTLDPRIMDTPWNGYPISYVAMTHARDVERCQGILSTSDRANRLIGDRLADIMSRWLVLSVKSCALNLSQGDAFFGFCAAMNRIQQQNADTMSATLEMTAVYLSSHMASSLVAVVMDDLFWQQEFPANTHCSGDICSQNNIAARLEWIKRYKVYYDLNNRFLAQNLSTVVSSLQRRCYLRGPAFNFGAFVIDRVPGLELLFGAIRDRTFAAAISQAQVYPPQAHPVIEKGEDGFKHPQFSKFRAYSSFPTPLIEAESFARSALKGATLLTASLSGLGSRSWDDLKATPPSQDARCKLY